MRTLNLLTEYHGLRAKFYRDFSRSKKPVIPVFSLIVIAALIISITAGFIFSRKLIFYYFEEPEEMDALGEQAGKPPSVQPAGDTVDTRVPPVKPAGQEQPPPGSGSHALPATGKKSVFGIKIATMIIKSNAISINKRLLTLGYDSFIKTRAIPLPTYRISYRDLKGDKFEKVKNTLEEKGISFHITIEGNNILIESEETFIRPFLLSTLKEIESKGIRGEIIKGKKKRAEVYEVIAGKYRDKPSMTAAREKLKSKGFAPLTVELE